MFWFGTLNKVKNLEHLEQCTLIEWFDLTHKDLCGRLSATPNGGMRNIVVAKKLKREGVRKGFPDLTLPVPRHGKFGLYIEMKKVKGAKPSAEQSDWIEFLRAQGYRAEVCYGFDEARVVINGYLNEM